MYCNASHVDVDAHTHGRTVLCTCVIQCTHVWIELLQSDQATAKQESGHLEEGDGSGQALEGVSKFTPLDRREGVSNHEIINVQCT